MAITDLHVNPGDLITSKFFNDLIQEIVGLNERVTKLEANVPQPGQGVTLKQLTGSVRINDEITVEGTNFEVPARLNDVKLAGIPILTYNPGTDSTHLVFNVPDIPGAPKDVALSVTNRHGSASTTITVLPRGQAIPQGELIITPQTVSHGTIQQGNVYLFPFTLDSQTDIPETYRLAALYDSVVGSSADQWRTNTRIQNMSGVQIDRVTVAPRSPVTVQVRVQVPSGATSANLLLRSFSINNPTEPKMNLPSTPVAIVIGQATEVSDPRTGFGQLTVALPGQVVEDPDPSVGRVLEVPATGSAMLRINAEFTIAGDYAYSALILPAAPAHWQPSVIIPNPPTTSETANGSQEIVVQLSAPSADTTLPFRTLEIHAERTGPGGETFDSWFSIHIRNS